MSDPVIHYRDGREVCADNTAGKAEYKRRITLMWERQGHICCLCYQPIRLAECTFDHEKGRGMSGSIRNDAITMPDGTWINGAAHWKCNAAKGSRRGNYNQQGRRYETRN